MTVTTRLKAVLMAALLATLVGCATVGQDFATHNVDQILLGETTRDDVQRMFGEPWRTGLKDGKRTWTYGKYRWSAFNDAETTDLVITFDANGVVESYVYNTTQ
ncbi:MAG: outer membrane protein assembly factor BamE [Marinobacter sp.]|uniref:outer membrane protein assembly factor BamE domain-containing protein n=1 Tax=Marinobacter sp. TaxID=50741 RepID=UPI00299F32C8|nr:outer membrane protein assembly factor BamE [Marinobacter sp.]MDX1757681.1 outer membrane protein assembly factor BamE [Marinobacter sp.]